MSSSKVLIYVDMFKKKKITSLHHQCCFMRSLGVWGLSTIRDPRPGNPAGVDQAPKYCIYCNSPTS